MNKSNSSKKRGKNSPSPSASPRRRSRRTAGDNPKIEVKGLEVLLLTDSVKVTKQKVTDHPVASNNNKAGENQLERSKESVEGDKPKDTSTTPNEPSSAGPLTESKGKFGTTVKEVDKQKDAEHGKEETEAEKSAELVERKFITIDDNDDAGDSTNESQGDADYNPFNSVKSHTDPVTHEQFEFFVSKIGDIVEQRLQTFANQVGMNPPEQTNEVCDENLSERIHQPSKPEFIDPVILSARAL